MPGKRMTFAQRIKIQVYLEDKRNTSIVDICKATGLNRVTIYIVTTELNFRCCQQLNKMKMERLNLEFSVAILIHLGKKVDMKEIMNFLDI